MNSFMRRLTALAPAAGLVLVVSTSFHASASEDTEPDSGGPAWCVSPVLPGPCARYPASRRRTTLTAVINAPASPGDSVDVYRGTYTDRPNVTIPDLKIRGIEGPEVTIFDGLASSEAALKVNAGGVVLDGFTFTHSAGGDGGGVEADGSPATPTPCQFGPREKPTDPITISCPQALTGDFTLKNSRASGNRSPGDCGANFPRCYGVKVIATGRVTITDVEASNNGSSGGDCKGSGYALTKNRGLDGESCFGIMATSTASDVVLKDVDAEENRAKGRCLNHETCFGVAVDDTVGSATLEKVTATRNGADLDCSGDDVCFGIAADGVQGKVTMKKVEAQFNGAQGACAGGGTPRLNDSCNGIMVDGEDFSLGLWIDGAVASHNGAFGGSCGIGNDSCVGLLVDGHGGDIDLQHVEAEANGAAVDCNGTDMCTGILHDDADLQGNITFVDLQATHNGAGQDCIGRDTCAGVLHDGGFCTLSLNVRDIEASHNGAGRNCRATDSCQGFVIDAGDNTGPFHIESVTANNNGAGGDCGGVDDCDGVLIDGGGIEPTPPAPPDLVCPVLVNNHSEPFSLTLVDVEANSNGAGRDCSAAADQCSGVIADGAQGDIVMKHVTAEQNHAGRDCLGPDSCAGVTADSAVGSIALKDVESRRNGAVNSCSFATSCYGLTATTEGAPGNVELVKTQTLDNKGNGTVVTAFGNIEFECVVSSGNGRADFVTNKPPAIGACEPE